MEICIWLILLWIMFLALQSVRIIDLLKEIKDKL